MIALEYTYDRVHIFFTHLNEYTPEKYTPDGSPLTGSGCILGAIYK